MYICAFRKRIHTFKHYIYKVVVAVRVGVQTRLVIVVGARRQGARGGKGRAAARQLLRATSASRGRSRCILFLKTCSDKSFV